MESHDTRLREQVRSYYGTVGRYIERELHQRDDRDFWRRMVREAEVAPPHRPAVLELGCGTGRITEVLASEAETVVGIDICSAMIRRARARFGDSDSRDPSRSSRPTDSRGRVHLVMADMRSLRLTRRFDLIVAANDPFVHLVEDEDRVRALRTARRHLAVPDGTFVLEGFWLSPERLRKASTPEGYRRERRVTLEGSELEIREWWRCGPGTHRCAVRFQYLERREIVDEASFRARLWDPDTIESTFDRAGLEIRRLHGGFGGRPFDARTARHLIIEATAGAIDPAEALEFT